MSKKKIAFLAVVIITASVFLTYLAIPRISIALLARAYDLEISYKSAYFTPYIGADKTEGLKVGIDMKDVRISKKGGAVKTYDSIGALVSAPFDGSLKYREIRGTLRPQFGRIFIDDLIADAGDMKISLKGVFIYAEDTADLEVVINFSQNLLKKIPRELSDTVLKSSQDGWQSLSVHLKGSFKSPSIELTGRLFKLSIREVSGS